MPPITTTSDVVPTAVENEKIIFEIKSVLWPTIINLENLITIGFVVISVIASVVFHFGLAEILIIVALFLVLTIPSLRSIFRAGSTTYVLTNHRLVIFSVGFGPKEQSIPLTHIQDVSCKYSGLQRLYRAGDIVIKQKGLRRPVRLLGLVGCKSYAERILQAARRVK